MKLAIVSPLSISRKALCALLAPVPQLNVVIDVDNPLENFENIQKTAPSVLLFDTLNPAADLEIIVRTQKLLPQVKILVLAARVDEDLELRAIKAGARGCISKGSDPQLLAKALTLVDRGEVWISHRMASRIIGEFVESGKKASEGTRSGELSRREWEILALVAQGFRNKEIARRLFICESTTKTHLYAIYKKLEISSRLEAIIYYFHVLGEGIEMPPAQVASLSQSQAAQSDWPEGPSVPADS
jgi:DNA-binding NarL/FixJ family response regulator